ncbi:MAG: site-specific integrase [Candidatus Competibacter sp.]|nr:site-specific integrase [Candidatus Competibacter sp.]MDG4604509.1 site-specific integrase [Candidatus Contendobacter sp.]
MPRTVRNAQLETRTARSRLTTRPTPYWHSIDPGLHLGYRKGKRGGRWLLRWYKGNEHYIEERIGIADDFADADEVAILSFAKAQALARSRATILAQDAAGIVRDQAVYTVADAITAYLLWMEQHRKSAPDARNRAEAFILPALGKLRVVQLTSEKIRHWLSTLANTPPRTRTRPQQPQNFRDTRADPDAARKRKATANRILTTLKAALNLAWREGHVADDSEWRRVKPFAQADAARIRYLTLEESQRLINASDPALRDLISAALATGCRHGELARLVVADFNATVGRLHIREAKSGQGRHVVLTEEGIALFTRLTLGKTGDDRLLQTGAGLEWTHNLNQRPLLKACRHARIDPPISFHVLRHTYASLAVMAGMPSLVLAQNLGHKDTRMVEKHYGHLAPSYLADAVRASAPRFGLATESSVIPFAKIS